MNIGKVLLIFFEGNEEKVIDSIISVLGVGREKFAFQQMYSNSEVNYKDIIFDFKRREVVKSNEENPGRVFSKEQIYDIVWNEPYSGDYNIVMSHISHIREKIEDDPSHPVYIQTVWGVGYKFNEKMCE